MNIRIYGINLEVEATYHKAYKGARDSLGGVTNAGPPLEPDEPAEFEITSVTHEGEDILGLLGCDILGIIGERLWEDGDSDER